MHIISQAVYIAIAWVTTVPRLLFANQANPHVAWENMNYHIKIDGRLLRKRLQEQIILHDSSNIKREKCLYLESKKISWQVQNN